MIGRRSWSLIFFIVLQFSGQQNINAFNSFENPNFPSLDKIPLSNVSGDPLLQAACKKQAGYYENPKRNPALNNTIFMTSVNLGFMEFYLNFKCYTDRLGIKLLTIAFDEETLSIINHHTPGSAFMLPKRDANVSHAWDYGNQHYRDLTCRKTEAVAAVLHLGYDVLFSDVDIAMPHDPLPYVFFDGVDYTHSVDAGCKGHWSPRFRGDGNSGFYSVKSNPRTIKVFDYIYRLCEKRGIEDQPVMWSILRHINNPKTAYMPKCPLPNYPTSTTQSHRKLFSLFDLGHHSNTDTAKDIRKDSSSDTNANPTKVETKIVSPPPPPSPPTVNHRVAIPSSLAKARMASRIASKLNHTAHAHVPLPPISIRANEMYHITPGAGQLITCPLDDCMFSSGNIRNDNYYDKLMRNLRSDKHPLITAHANFMVGTHSKYINMVKRGMWLVRYKNDSDLPPEQIYGEMNGMQNISTYWKHKTDNSAAKTDILVDQTREQQFKVVNTLIDEYLVCVEPNGEWLKEFPSPFPLRLYEE